MEIIVTDRAALEAGLRVAGEYVVISIHDPHRPPVKVPAEPGLRGVLTLAFYDAERPADLDKPDPAKLMTPEQAGRLWEFIDEHRGEVGTIVIHCEQGISRSPAVAAALSRAWGLDDRRYWREYQPNRHVYRLVLRARRGPRGTTRGP